MRSPLVALALAVAVLAAGPSPVTGASGVVAIAAATAVAPPALPEGGAPTGPEAILSLPVTEGDPNPGLDWGRVPMLTLLEGRVTVTNRSSDPVTVLAMRASCTCTALDDLSGQTVAPGESATARITVETRSIPGRSTNQVRFVFSDQTTASVDLVFTAGRAVETDPPYISALDVIYGVTRVKSVDGRPFRILRTNGEAPVYASAFDPARDEPRSEYLVVWNLEQYDAETCTNAAGRLMPLYWAIETDHPAAPIVELRVRHDPCTRLDGPRGTRRWFLSRNHHVFGRLEAGTTHEFDVDMKWVRNSPVNDSLGRVSTTSDRFAAELIEVTREGDVITGRVRLTLKPGTRGFVNERIVFHGENPNHTQWFPVIGTVVAPSGG